MDPGEKADVQVQGQRAPARCSCCWGSESLQKRRGLRAQEAAPPGYRSEPGKPDDRRAGRRAGRHQPAELWVPGTALDGDVGMSEASPGKVPPGEAWSLAAPDRRPVLWEMPARPRSGRAQCIPPLSRPEPGAWALRILLHQSYCREQTINSGAKLKVRGRV